MIIFKAYSGKFNKLAYLFNKKYHILKIFLEIWGLKRLKLTFFKDS
jgi:hypothetical protein